MLDRNQCFDVLGQQAYRVVCSPKMPSESEKKIFFVLQRLAGGSITDPVRLILVELLQTLAYKGKKTENTYHLGS